MTNERIQSGPAAGRRGGTRNAQREHALPRRLVAGGAVMASMAAALLVLAALPAVGHAQAVDSTARPISLAEALATARSEAPQAIAARGQVRTSKAAVRSAQAAFLPNLSVSVGATRQSDVNRTRINDQGQLVTLPSTPWSYNTGLGANLTLFDGGSRWFELHGARAAVGAAAANEVAQRYAVELNVKQQYYAVLAARESEVAARAQLEQAEQQRRTALVKVRAGNATKSDSLRSEIQVNDARLAVLDAQNAIQSADASLTRAIGSSTTVTAAGQEPESAGTSALDDATLAPLAAQGPAVLQARAERDAVRSAKNGSWSAYLPTVSASWNRSGSGSGADLAFGANDLDYAGTFRLALTLPLFDRLGREEQVVRADVALDNAEAALRDAELAARESLTRSLGALRTAEQRVQAQSASVAAAEEDLRVQQRRYSVGTATLVDVLTSQTQLQQARQALIQARYDQRIARAQLAALIGREP